MISCWFFFFFNDTATTEIYTLSLHDALPISSTWPPRTSSSGWRTAGSARPTDTSTTSRSEEHTSELQSLAYLVCRLLLEKKKIRSLRYHDIMLVRNSRFVLVLFSFFLEPHL